MKRFKLFLLLLAALFTATPAVTFAQTIQPADLPAMELFHLFLLAGQSNMAGRGDVAEQNRRTNPRILALNANGEWIHAVDPIHWDKPVAGVGLARSFAVEYLKDHPGATIGFIPAACGGSPIAVWQPGAFFEQTNSHPYDDAISRTRTATKTGTLKGILWHQGESDCHTDLAAKYEAALAGLIARFRADLSAPDLPVVLGQLGQFGPEPWGEPANVVDTATRRIADGDPLAVFATSDGLTCKADGIHFDSTSLHELGRRYYRNYKAIAGTNY